MLETAMSNLKGITKTLKELQENHDEQKLQLLRDKEESLRVREAVLLGLQTSLEKKMSSAEIEASRYAALSKELELRLSQQEQEMHEERKRAQNRELCWEQEKKVAVDMLEREKARMEKLQTDIQDEVASLTAQKLELAADVARLETTIQLHETSASRKSQNVEQMEAEARTTLEAAKNVNFELQQERERLENFRRNIMDEEEKLTAREKELVEKQVQIQKDVEKTAALHAEAMNAREEARLLERQRVQFYHDFTTKLQDLSERENKLVKDKLAVSAEWKIIQQSRNISSCPQCLTSSMEPNLGHTYAQNIVDPIPIIASLQAEKESFIQSYYQLPTANRSAV